MAESRWHATAHCVVGDGADRCAGSGGVHHRDRQLVEGSLGMVCTHDLLGKLLTINTHGAEMLGRKVEEMTGHNLAEFYVPEKHDELTAYLQEIGETGEAQGMFNLSHADGEVRDVAYRNRLIVAPGRAPYVLGFGVD